MKSIDKDNFPINSNSAIDILCINKANATKILHLFMKNAELLSGVDYVGSNINLYQFTFDAIRKMENVKLFSSSGIDTNHEIVKWSKTGENGSFRYNSFYKFPESKNELIEKNRIRKEIFDKLGIKYDIVYIDKKADAVIKVINEIDAQWNALPTNIENGYHMDNNEILAWLNDSKEKLMDAMERLK